MHTLPRLSLAAALLATATLTSTTPAQDGVEVIRACLGIAAPANGPTADYVAHEWGTFTSMADSRGIVLEGLHHEEEHLPAFVHDLRTIAETGVSDSKLPASHVTQKMETPVIYFHADQPLQARVTVLFRQGLMTQFYPLPSTIFPRLADARRELVDMRAQDWSSLCWDIDVVPRSQAAPAEIPAVASDDPWHFARQTSACYVRTRPPANSGAHVEAEHYLFYRGLGRWQPPVATTAARGGKVRFANQGAHAIPFCLALELGEPGGRFALGQPIANGAHLDFDLAGAAWIADREQFSRRVGAAVLRALVEQGLYPDEARAMVATWSRSWFQKDGARIVHLLPREVVDEVLPLSLEPQPRSLVRVLVGRHEYITPEAQDRVEQALCDEASPDAALHARGAAMLAGLDRFLEPHLRNVAHNGTSEAVRRTAAAKLAEMSR